MIANLTKFQDEQEEVLYIDTAEAEHVEMYLKAILTVWERKQEVKVSSIAKLLNNILQPSVVHMLHKLNDANFWLNIKVERTLLNLLAKVTKSANK
jgi:Mn-dependent DtxR family transcriptional regulator